MTTRPKYTGTLRRGTEPGTIVGSIFDAWNWEITLHGVRQEDGSYKLTGDLGETPPSLRLPVLGETEGE